MMTLKLVLVLLKDIFKFKGGHKVCMMLLKFKIQNLSYLSVQTPRMNEYRSCL